MEETDYKCLRCGHEFKSPYDRKVPTEQACPECHSNSVRRVKKRPHK